MHARSFKTIKRNHVLAKAWGAFLFMCVTSLTAFSDSVTFQDDAVTKVDFPNAIKRINTLWETGKIERIELIHIPTNIVFRKSVSSSTLDANFKFKLVINDPVETRIGSEIILKLKSLRAEPLGRYSDLRWGIVFYSANNARSFALYFDESGTEGVVEGACVKFDSNLLKKWADSKFGNILK